MGKILAAVKLAFLILLCVLLVRMVTLRRGAKNVTAGQVAVSGYVPYTLVKQISGGTVPVTMLMPPNAEPHSFEPSPGVLVGMREAAAFVYISDELEPWAKDLRGALAQNAPVLVLSSVAGPSADPHIWMNLDYAQQMARAVKDLLVQVSPANAALYENNLSEFLAQTDALKQDFGTLAHCPHKEVVHIGHLAFAPLTERYGLRLRALSGTSHEGEHSAQKLAELTKLIKQSGVKTIFTEETLSGRLAQTVAQETGAQILPLYPVEHISKTDFTDGVTYAQLMRRNLDNLKRGLLCR